MHPKAAEVLGRPQWAQRTPEWYEIRRTLLTASDIASALDIKPYASYKGSPRADLLVKKLENRPFSNMFTAHGQKYEDEARDRMADALDEKVHDVGLLVHPDHPWLAASPDGITETAKCVEIKCPLRRAIVPGQVPSHYWPQIQVQMQTCGLDTTLFVQYRPASMNSDKRCVLDITVVPRDDGWFERKLPLLKAFHEEYMLALQTFVPPPPPPRRMPRIRDNLYDDLLTFDS